MLDYFSPASFDHELPGKVGGRLRLQRPDHNGLVQWVTWDNLTETEREGGREGEREGGRVVERADTRRRGCQHPPASDGRR